MRRIYHTLGICALLIWLGLTVHQLTGADTSPSVIDLPRLAADTLPEESWAGIYFNNRKIGYSHTTRTPLQNGFRFQEEMVVDLTVMQVPQRIHTTMATVTDYDGTLSVLNYRLRSGVISFSLYGTRQEDQLSLAIKAGGRRTRTTVTVPAGVLSGPALRWRIAGAAAAKRDRSCIIFDPVTMHTRTLELRYDGRETLSIAGRDIICARIVTDYQGVPVRTWVGPDGAIVREESPLGFVMQRETEAQARSVPAGEGPDIARSMSIPIDRAFAPIGLRQIRLRLGGIDPAQFQLDGGRQSIDDGLLLITAEPESGITDYQRPCSLARFAPHLTAELFLPVGDPALKAVVTEAVRPDDRARAAVRKLTHWVYAAIDKTPTMSVPDALQVLDTRQGDCNEHAVLLTALCRTAGVPARMCAGLVYLDGRFYYHAWVEVWLGRWVPTDPTTDQFPADLTHIRFVHGDLDSQATLLRLIGTLTIEIIDLQ